MAPERFTPLPPSPDRDRALLRLGEAAAETGEGERLSRLDEATRAFLGDALGDAPYLLDLAVKDAGRLLDIVADDPARRIEAIVAAPFPDGDAKAAMAGLRKAKADVALTLALADLGHLLDLDEVTRLLSRFADWSLDAALGLALEAARAKGRIASADPASSGLALIAMGKHGADELNYSSDIDIIAVHDAEKAGLAPDVEPSTFYVGLVKAIVRTLQERTADGYVFRVDLRLRPDPGATPVAISYPAALSYYEALGQNWERAALIKARAAAGDRRVGNAFLNEIAPFIWRRHLDFAAIADIHSIKRQVHVHKGHGAIRVAGHDVKRGRGGIREIELFVQTQQLIAGGRDKQLRGIATLPMLASLEGRGWITARAKDALSRSYRFLRRLEHRIQMVNDEQTHVIPSEPLARGRVERLSGFADAAAFETEVTATLGEVAERYGRLFENEPTLGAEGGSLVFTGGEDDPETLLTLEGLGYRTPSRVTEAVRAWHFGRFPAMRSARAREALTEITPALLAALARSGDADAAFAAFDALLKGLPAGVQLFSALAANPRLLDLLALLLGAAPKLAEAFGRHPHVVDAFLDPTILAEAVTRDAQAERLDGTLALAPSFEAALDRVRAFANEHRFLLSIRLITGALGPSEAGRAFSALAEAVVDRLFALTIAEFERAHGRVAGARAAVLALGRLGSAEMTARSDLDLIVIYDHPEETIESDGRRPLAPSQYYARLTQRLIAAISAPTAEGIAYPVDMRLRPSGRKGPLATRLDAFRRYQAEDAWTWEHMALTRARAVAGDASLAAEIEAAIDDILSRPRPQEALKADVLSMRGQVEDAKGSASPFAFKQVAGGLMDAEFVAQFALLAGLSRNPPETAARTLTRAAEAGIVEPDEAAVLSDASRLQAALQQAMAATIAGEGDGVTPALAAVLAGLARAHWPEGAGDAPRDFADLEASLPELQARARAAFLRVLGSGGGVGEA